MPIYEFYCPACHTIFSFLSRKVDTSRTPGCPKCHGTLRREVSLFAAVGKAREEDGAGDLPVDESRMEQAMESLAGEAENINEDDPRQAAQLMRRFSQMTGMEFNAGMESALSRLEAGEDPEQIEADMGDAIEGEDPFVMPGRGRKGRSRRRPPARDNTLHEM